MPQVYLQIWARVDWAGGGASRQLRACSETRGIVQRFRLDSKRFIIAEARFWHNMFKSAPPAMQQGCAGVLRHRRPVIGFWGMLQYSLWGSGLRTYTAEYDEP